MEIIQHPLAVKTHRRSSRSVHSGAQGSLRCLSGSIFDENVDGVQLSAPVSKGGPFGREKNFPGKKFAARSKIGVDLQKRYANREFFALPAKLVVVLRAVKTAVFVIFLFGVPVILFPDGFNEDYDMQSYCCEKSGRNYSVRPITAQERRG